MPPDMPRVALNYSKRLKVSHSLVVLIDKSMMSWAVTRSSFDI